MEEILELKAQASISDAAETRKTVINNSEELQRRSSTDLDYSEFFWNYMNANRPIVLANISNQWECRRQWTAPRTTTLSETKTTAAINFDYLQRKIGNPQVPVADCRHTYYNSHAKKEMPFLDFLAYWQRKTRSHEDEPGGDHILPPTTRSAQQIAADSNNDNDSNFYLKDWHLASQMPEYKFYQVPKHFASDWLNEYLVTTGRDDYRFVYMGPKGTWTPFHADVFGSYSWSTNICGCKKWLLLPPGEELKLKDSLGNLPFSIDESVLEHRGVHFYSLLQRENEALFVPSGWHHQVWNITDTISVNHNWFNACNIQSIWQNLSSNMAQVIKEIDDCRSMDNFDSHCQMMLRATFGLNYFDFLDILEFIAEQRIQGLRKDMDETSEEATIYKINDFHMKYDLQSMAAVLDQMLEDAVVTENRIKLYGRCRRLWESVQNQGKLEEA